MKPVAQVSPAEYLLREAEDLLDERQIASAIDHFDHAERAGANPDGCAAGRWRALMLAGDFTAAWQQSDAIRSRGAPDPHRFWLGEPLAGKRLVIRCLHGLGDAVQMLRYLPLLRGQCTEVIVEVPPRLLSMATCFMAIEHVITWGEQAPAEPPPWDVQVECMELPYLFRTIQADLPIVSRYLCVPPSAVQQVTQNMGSAKAPRVGIVWSSSEWDPTRCLPMASVARLLAVPGIEFWNLQGGAAHESARHEKVLGDVHDAASLGDGLLPLAAAITNMDLIISVDTLAVHLAGAIGQDAWVLLQYRADWRWMHLRDDSPWYPTLRLFRQSAPDDWDSLTTRVCEELKQWKDRRI